MESYIWNKNSLNKWSLEIIHWFILRIFICILWSTAPDAGYPLQKFLCIFFTLMLESIDHLEFSVRQCRGKSSLISDCNQTYWLWEVTDISSSHLLEGEDSTFTFIHRLPWQDKLGDCLYHSMIATAGCTTASSDANAVTALRRISVVNSSPFYILPFFLIYQKVPYRLNVSSMSVR